MAKKRKKINISDEQAKLLFKRYGNKFDNTHTYNRKFIKKYFRLIETQQTEMNFKLNDEEIFFEVHKGSNSEGFEIDPNEPNQSKNSTRRHDREINKPNDSQIFGNFISMFIFFVISGDSLVEILGDLEEKWRNLADRQGKKYANYWLYVELSKLGYQRIKGFFRNFFLIEKIYEIFFS